MFIKCKAILLTSCYFQLVAETRQKLQRPLGDFDPRFPRQKKTYLLYINGLIPFSKEYLSLRRDDTTLL